MNEEKRGLRFPFSADAEIIVDSSPKRIPLRVKELSFRGCLLEQTSLFKEQERVQVKIFHADEYFESLAEVIYVRPNGVGLVFGEMKPHSRNVLQTWILATLDKQAKIG